MQTRCAAVVIVQGLRFVPFWLTFRQTAFDGLILKAQPAELIKDNWLL